MDLRIPPSKVFFFFQTSTVFFSPFLKYNVIFPNQSRDYKSEYDIIGLTKLISLKFMSLQYVVFKELHHRKYCESSFFPSL